MRTRTRNGLVLLAFSLVLAAALTWVARHQPTPKPSSRTLGSIPSGAMLVATADIAALRTSGLGAQLLKGRDIAGLGKVRDVCGFDPMDSLEEIAVAIPAAGEDGEFGFVGAGPIEDEKLLSCASKIITARGGRPLVTRIGTFRTVRDVSLAAPGGEIAVRPKGPVLLSGGNYLRAMIDCTEAHSPTVESSDVHRQLMRVMDDGETSVVVVLTDEQRRALADELTLDGAPVVLAASMVAAGLGIKLGTTVAIQAVIACTTEQACTELGVRFEKARQAKLADMGTRRAGLTAILARVQQTMNQGLLQWRVDVAASEATVLLDRWITPRTAPILVDDDQTGGSDDVVPPPADQIIVPGAGPKSPRHDDGSHQGQNRQP